jgi:hypothetical protein
MLIYIIKGKNQMENNHEISLQKQALWHVQQIREKQEEEASVLREERNKATREETKQLLTKIFNIDFNNTKFKVAEFGDIVRVSEMSFITFDDADGLYVQEQCKQCYNTGNFQVKDLESLGVVLTNKNRICPRCNYRNYETQNKKELTIEERLLEVLRDFIYQNSEG